LGNIFQRNFGDRRDMSSPQDFLSQKTIENLEFYFTIDGVDYSDYVTRISTLSRNVRSITLGNISVTLANTTQIFNSILTNKGAWLKKECKIGFLVPIYLWDEYLWDDWEWADGYDLFTGVLDDADFREGEVDLTLRDGVSVVLETKVGDDDSFVVNDDNKYLDFARTGWGEMHAEIAEGTYKIPGLNQNDVGSLCEAIYNAMVAMDPVSSFTVSSSNSTKKFTITRSTGELKLLWKSGKHGSHSYFYPYPAAGTNNNIGTLLGFDTSSDDIGSASYTADNSVIQSLNYFHTSYNPADLAWELLTVYGGLDTTASSANTDIDYDLWVAWKSYCTTFQYLIQGYFTNETIEEILNKIARITDSMIYVTGAGKIGFRIFIEDTTSPMDITRDDLLEFPRVFIDSSELINYLTVYYGYNPANQIWTSSHIAQNSQSQTDFGLFTLQEKDVVIWHAGYYSAEAYVVKKLDREREPVGKTECLLPLKGFTTGVGRGLDITEAFRGFVNKGLRIEVERGEIEKGNMNLEGVIVDLKEWLILSDPVFGELGTKRLI
jgi:hypothetical protein